MITGVLRPPRRLRCRHAIGVRFQSPSPSNTGESNKGYKKTVRTTQTSDFWPSTSIPYRGPCWTSVKQYGNDLTRPSRLAQLRLRVERIKSRLRPHLWYERIVRSTLAD